MHILFSVIIIPAAVLREFHAETTPESGKSWMARFPEWLEIPWRQAGRTIRHAFGRDSQALLRSGMQANVEF